MLANSKFGLNSLIECRATCTLHQASSGSFGSFVFSQYTNNKQVLHIRVKRKAHWRPPKITPFIVLNSSVSTTVLMNSYMALFTVYLLPKGINFALLQIELCASVKGWWLEDPAVKTVIDVVRLRARTEEKRKLAIADSYRDSLIKWFYVTRTTAVSRNN